jgi:murein DD-endopeptidase MepM/ murein hydrolase activator NlpD
MHYVAAVMSVLIATLATPAWSDSCFPADEAPQFSVPISGTILFGFGSRQDADGMMRIHTGVDYAAEIGEPVHAAASGQVMSAEMNGPYGLYIKLAHSDGFETAYAHLSEIKVHKGDCVRKGDVIGLSGMSKQTPLLHFEVLRDSRFLNPESVLRVRRPTP